MLFKKKGIKQKRLKKAELLEMLISISEENEALKSEISELHKKMSEREIRIQKAGSIAEAALAINDVFKSAQAAADQYLNNIERLNANMEIESQILIQKTKEECLQMQERAKQLIVKRISSISSLEADE